MRRHFDSWLDAYHEYTQHSESPKDFHLWTAIGVIAGALRRKVYMDMGYFQWYPNFFIFFVGPPGIVSKSTTADIGMSLLRQVEGIKFGPSAITWQALIRALGESQEDYLMPNGEYMPMSAITLVASELGTFLDPSNREMIDVLVDLWDGKTGSWSKITKMDGEESVENPWINMVGCTTPAWIAENFSNYFVGGGFASRSIFVYGDYKRQLIAYPKQNLEEKHHRIKRHLIEDLEQIALLQGEYILSPQALEWGTDWYAKHFAQSEGLRRDPRFGGYFARKQTHIHKTAMVRAASCRNKLVIELEDLIWAEHQVTLLEKGMVRIYGSMNKEEITTHQANLLSAVREAGKIKKSDFYSSQMNVLGLETFDAALAGLLAANLVRFVQYGPTVYIEYNGQEIESRLTDSEMNPPPIAQP